MKSVDGFEDRAHPLRPSEIMIPAIAASVKTLRFFIPSFCLNSLLFSDAMGGSLLAHRAIKNALTVLESKNLALPAGHEKTRRL